MKRTNWIVASLAVVGFSWALMAEAQVAAPQGGAPAAGAQRGGFGPGGPGAPGGGARGGARGGGRGPVQIGPSAPVPPQVAIPRPSPTELAQINDALKRFVETDSSPAAPVLKKYQSLLTVQAPRLNTAATYTQTQQRMGPRHEQFVETAKKGDIDLLLHGDSITDWWVMNDANREMFNKYFGNIKTANFAIAGDTTQGVLWGLKVHGEAVYSSRPFEVFGDNTVCYTRNNGHVYATLLDWDGGAITLNALRSGGATLGKVMRVECLGSDTAMSFTQNAVGLTVTPQGPVTALAGISNEGLAGRCRTLKITHDKGWINDDDPGITAVGWMRRCNLGTGDFNNDLTGSTAAGDVWKGTFSGSGVSIIAPREAGAGSIEVQIDGQSRGTVSLAASGPRQAQQVVSEVTGLAQGRHTISIINRGPGPVAIDAVVVR